MNAQTLAPKARIAPPPVDFTTKANFQAPHLLHAKPPEQLEAWIIRGRDERFLVETLVTPEMAKFLLDKNPGNRAVNTKTVKTYAEAMLRGEWHLNGQSIIVSDTGELNDGQHRLMAVILASRPILMSLYFGPRRQSKATLDVGRKRTLGDHFAMAKLTHTNTLAATVRLAWCYDNNYMWLSNSPSVEQAFNYLDQNPGIHKYVSISHTLAKSFKGPTSEFAFAAYVCSRINEAVTDDLLQKVRTGVGIEAVNSAAARTRERLILHATGRTPFMRDEAAATFIKAFNAEIDGRRMRPISWARKGPRAEAFPVAGKF